MRPEIRYCHLKLIVNYLKRVHNLVTLLEAEEVGDITRHFREVDVSDAKLASARFRHPYFGEGRFSLT
jgi:hypothetical protein